MWQIRCKHDSVLLSEVWYEWRLWDLKFLLNMSLPERMMMSFEVFLTLESVDEILSCNHSNEACLLFSILESIIWKLWQNLTLVTPGSEKVKPLKKWFVKKNMKILKQESTLSLTSNLFLSPKLPPSLHKHNHQIQWLFLRTYWEDMEDYTTLLMKT